MNGSAEGRTDAFMGGAQSASFRPISPIAFHPTSVLDKNQVVKNANGRSAADQSRTFVNGTPQSVNGTSSDTFQDKAWIGNPLRTFG